MPPAREPMRSVDGYEWCWFMKLGHPDECDSPSTLPEDIFRAIQRGYEGSGTVLFYTSREAALKDYEAVVKSLPARDQHAGL